MVKLTFFGGVNEIGGNKILLEDRDTNYYLNKFLVSFKNISAYLIDSSAPNSE